MMLQSTVFCALLAVTTAQIPGSLPANLPSSCAAALCVQGTICREVLDPTTGVVQAQCLNSVPVSNNRQVCSQGQPLLVASAQRGITEASCGLSQFRISCPLNYLCNVAPNDAYAVCCQGNGPGQQPGQQKPGQCPALQPGSVGICASTCGSDGDCQGAQKCCRNPCGAQTCQNPAQLVPVPQRPSCATVRCGQGQTCVMQEVRCFRAPCFPQPICVASAVTKSGTCPARASRQGLCGTRCQTDGGCPGTSKCCRSFFCGRTCQQPLELRQQQQTRFTCANVRCRSGYVCQDRPVQCFAAPCPTRPVCTRTLIITAPGQCPAFPAVVIPNCQQRNQCFSGNGFSTCPPGTLCCSTPCGRQCIRGQ